MSKRVHLSGGVGAEVDGGDLVDLVDGARVDVGGFNVAAAQPALAQSALADCVEAEQLVLVVGRSHVHHHLLAAHKWPLILHEFPTMIISCLTRITACTKAHH